MKADQHPLAFETLEYNETQPLPQLLDMFGLPRNTDPWDRRIYGNVQNEETLELWGVAASLKMRFGGVDFTSITAYRTHDYFSRDDSDRSPLDIAYDGDPEEVDTFSEELRFSWTSGSLDWLLGAYYFDHSFTNLSYLEVGEDLAALFFGDPSLAALRTGSDGKLDTQSVAGFASVTWRASDELDFTFGGRYTHEKKDIDYVQVDPLFLAEHVGRSVANLSLNDIRAEVVLAFLHHLESVRGNCVNSRNCRLAAIKSFVEHLLRHDITWAQEYGRILAIPTKRTAPGLITYLEPDEVRAIIEVIDGGTPLGRRRAGAPKPGHKGVISSNLRQFESRYWRRGTPAATRCEQGVLAWKPTQRDSWKGCRRILRT